MPKYKLFDWKGEEKFARSIERAVKIIGSGLKVGADNLELILSKSDLETLGGMVDILNIIDIEYKQGKTKKYEGLDHAISNYREGDKFELQGIYRQAKRLEKEGKGKDKEEDLVISCKGRKVTLTPKVLRKLELLNTLQDYDIDDYHV